MTRRTRVVIATGVAFGGVLFAAAALGPVSSPSSLATPVHAIGPGGVPARSGASLDETIAALETRVSVVPGDHVAWATLAIAYVERARATVDPTWYPRAEAALERAEQLGGDDHHLAAAARSALAAARHDFPAAKVAAEHGLAVNQHSAILWGALGDAEVQLGDYDAAFDAIQRMVDLAPDTASLARASYAWELRGDLPRARALMQRALDDAPTATDRAFALVHLGGLWFDDGEPAAALESFNRALDAVPGDIAALAGKARAEMALGQIETAVDHWYQVVDRAPEPGHLIEFARLLESLGRTDEAAAQWVVFDATQQLFAANGVLPDAAATLAEAERGRIDDALAASAAGIRTRPFVDMYDARAWVLHLAGRHDEAMVMIEEAMSLGGRTARFHFHAGMIALSLGDTERAVSELETALEINPWFDPISAPQARGVLDEIGAGG